MLFLKITPGPLDKLHLVKKDKQSELKDLEQELEDALTGIESPDFERAARIQPLIYGLQFELERLERLATVLPPTQDFQAHISQLLTGMYTSLELWLELPDHYGDVTVRLLEIRKLKTRHLLSCRLQIVKPIDRHIYEEGTVALLQHIGWKATRGGKTFRMKVLLRSPVAMDDLCQRMSVTMLEGFGQLWQDRRQYYRLMK